MEEKIFALTWVIKVGSRHMIPHIEFLGFYTHIYINQQHHHMTTKQKHIATNTTYIVNLKHHQQLNTKSIHKMHNGDLSNQSAQQCPKFRLKIDHH